MRDDRTTPNDDPAAPDEGLIDLTGFDLGDLDTADGSCLAEALRHLVDTQSRNSEAVSGFQD
ncbi:FxSxx-COOH cyclophane-containing RiPP peptide [Actinoallomurus sp. NPDC050550]|uniref:FxSxx-COOH cyclophane-containing RiPP peptide n=1 Tax=Actinoallomurus sp. NPDC050550 TaxID=3154937 RepID=UPI0033E882AB